MSVGVVIVTHGKTCESLIEEATFVMGEPLTDVVPVSFARQAEGSNGGIEDIRAAMQKAHGEDGVLVLTDLMGASPSNRVADLLGEFDAVMVTGVNLAMLVSVLNYREQGYGLVVRKAVESGRRGVKIFQK
jgi:PTS system ascorbate-specific IIA component